MPRTWLFASALLATTSVWHGAVRVREAVAAARQQTPGVSMEQNSGSDCPFLRAHPRHAASRSAVAPDAQATCPFSGRRGKSTISLEDALELHGDAPQHKPAMWL